MDLRTLLLNTDGVEEKYAVMMTADRLFADRCGRYYGGQLTPSDVETLTPKSGGRHAPRLVVESTMASRVVSQPQYQLRNGTLGTEYAYVLERIKVLEREMQEIEDRLEQLHIRLSLAEGHPC